MNKDRELMQMVLEELEELADVGYGSKTVLEALRERLSQPEPEPVAWLEDSKGNKYEIPEANKGYLLKAMENGVMPDDLIEAYERGFSDGSLLTKLYSMFCAKGIVFKLIEENGLTLHGDIEHFAELVKQDEPVAWHEPGAYGNVTTHKGWALANGWEPLYKEKKT